MSRGYTAPVDPLAWEIVGEKLYLNYNAKIRKKWLKDRDELIEKANENWPDILKTASK